MNKDSRFGEIPFACNQEETFNSGCLVFVVTAIVLLSQVHLKEKSYGTLKLTSFSQRS